MARVYEAVIGLEVHAQLLSRTKAFCLVANEFGGDPNSRVGPVSGGLPGALPVLNEKAVELAVRAGLALDCTIQRKSVFSRKNYFYPDLPKGYQISQFDEPTCTDGYLDILPEGGSAKRVRIQRIHMEEDAGKSTHFGSTTLVNLNRAGVPLVEIVTHPDLRSPTEATAYLRKLHQILIFAGVCDGNMEEGNFRCDVNVSIRPVGQKELGTRCELKNLNSFRFVEAAIDFEVARQIALVEGGGLVVQETRGWDSAGNKTFTMRKKEEAHDYRYFPEPDLPPLLLTESYVDEVRRAMPELPTRKRDRFVKEYGLSQLDAEVLTSTKDLSQYFEETVAAGALAKTAANWITSELLRELKDFDGDIGRSPIRPTELAQLVKLIKKGTISGKIAKKVFEDMIQGHGDPEKIVREKGLVQVLDTGLVEAWVDEVLAQFPSQLAEYQGGRMQILGFFVGEIMKLSRGKANPALVNELLKKKTGIC